jgi:hypothetical protein
MNELVSDVPRKAGLSPAWCRVLAGLDTGVAAAIPLILWLIVHSVLRGEHWWAKLNVFGALFFGPGVYGMGLGKATVAGACVALVGYSLLGAVFGLLARPSGQIRNLLLATAMILSWQALADLYLWSKLDVYAPAYLPPLATLPGHLIYALSMTRFPRRLQALGVTFGDAQAAALFEPPARLIEPIEPNPQAEEEVESCPPPPPRLS